MASARTNDQTEVEPRVLEDSICGRHAERMAALGTMTAGLAHEIRNPLNAAHLQLSVVQRRLRQCPADAKGALEAVALADCEMQRLASLVDEFLDFSRPRPLRLHETDLRALTEEALGLTATHGAASGVALTLSPGAPVCVCVDPDAIKQVLLNLVRNAIEASGRGGTVEVAVHAHRQRATIAVSDDGPGLPAAQARMFEPFFTTKPCGTGLGLSIVHRLVTDHEGEISARRHQGRTVFTVSLPR